jgi:methionyl aminopeptidase
MVELKTPAEIDKMAVAGRFVAETLRDLSQQARPGVNLLEIEQRARRCLERRGAVSPYWDYAPSFGRGPFRNVICLSVNDAALHGRPHDRELRDGDVLSLDLACSIDGWVADSAVTVIVGTAREDDLRLVRSTREALAAGIRAAVPGARLGDVSAAIGEVAARYGYLPGVDFGGHGIGRSMHEDPHVANHGRPGRGLRLRPGMTLALEPWWAATTDALTVDADGWTLRSADGSRCAHAEHTIAVTDDHPRILTHLG